MGSGVDFNFPDLWRVFGGSVFADEYRGNLVTADEQIKHLETAAEDTKDSQAKAILLRSIHSVMTGQINLAITTLSRLLDPANGFDRHWQTRAITYQIFSNFAKRQPAFPFCPVYDDGLEGVLAKAANDKDAAASGKLAEQFDRGLSQMLPEEKNLKHLANLEFKCITKLIGYLTMRYRILATQCNPSAPSYHKEPKFFRVYLKRQQDFMELYKSLESLSAPLAQYIYRVVIDGFHAAGAGNEHQALPILRQMYEGNGDKVGNAITRIMEGDWMVSTAFSNITALNLVMAQSSGVSNQQPLWDVPEAGMAIGDIDGGTAHYSAALLIFEGREEPEYKRILGAIYLRLGCVAHQRAIFIPDGEAISFATASRSYAKASKLFEESGDQLSSKLVEAHQLVLDIRLDNPRDVVGHAASIGEWGRNSGSYVAALELGLFILRYGRRESLRRGSYEIPLRCYRSAYSLFRALDAPGSALQAKGSEATLLFKVFDNSSARIVVEEAQPLLLSLLQSLGQQQASPELEKCKDTLAHDTYTQFEGVYSALGLTALFQQLTTEIRRLSISSPTIEGNINLKDEIYNEVIRHRRAISSIVAKTRSDLLVCLETEGEEKATELLATVRSTLRQLEDIAFSKLAEVVLLSATGESAEAEKVFDEVSLVDLYRKDSTAPTLPYYQKLENIRGLLVSFNAALSSNQPGLAKTFFDQICELDSDYFSFTSKPGEWETMYMVGLMFEGIGLLPEALRMFARGSATIESQRRLFLDPDVRISNFGQSSAGNVFRAAARVCVKLHKNGEPVNPHEFNCEPPLTSEHWDEQALLFLELGKARQLLDSVLNNDNVPNDIKALVTEWTQCAHRLRQDVEEMSGTATGLLTRADRDRVKDLKERLTQIRQQVRERAPDLVTLLPPQGFTATASQLYANLPSDMAVIEFGIDDYGLVSIMLDSTGKIEVEYDSMNDIEALKEISKLYRHVTSRPDTVEILPDRQQNIQKVSNKLYQKLVEPFENRLQGKAHLVFVPSGVLFRLPFSALAKSTTPIVFSWTITQAPSLATFQQLRLRPTSTSPPQVSILSNVAPKKGSQLGYSAIQAIFVASRFNSAPILAERIDERSMNEALSTCTILHVTAHGHLDKTAPLLSSISLKDEPFRVLDLRKLRSGAELFVFSSCFSGTGKVTRSDDIIGFNHAVLASGVRSFIGALWEADDCAALLLMVLFYKGIQSGSLSFAAALQQAQIEMAGMTDERFKEIVAELKCACDVVAPGWIQTIMRPKVIQIWLDQLEHIPGSKFQDPYFWAPFIIVGAGIGSGNHEESGRPVVVEEHPHTPGTESCRGTEDDDLQSEQRSVETSKER